MQSFEILAAGLPCITFDLWIDTLQQAGIQAKQILVADCDAEDGFSPEPRPRGDEVYILVPVERLEDALKVLKALKTRIDTQEKPST